MALCSDHVLKSLLMFRTSHPYVQNVISLCSVHDVVSQFETKQHGLKWNGRVWNKTFQLWNFSMQKVKVFQRNLLAKRDPFWLLLFAMSWCYKRSSQPKNLRSQKPSLALRPTLEKAFQSISSVLKRKFQCWSCNGFLLVSVQKYLVL